MKKQNTVINGVEYAVCDCCGKPVKGSGRTIGGVIAVVVKNFVRNKEIVPLVDNTQKLLEHLGFKTIYRIRAWMTEEHGPHDMFTNERKKKSKKSFFRRLHEKKYPESAIDFEEVIIAVKQ